MKSFTFELNADDLPKDLEQVDLYLSGIDETGPSYEGRVFVDNPNANKNTETNSEHGYAGSFYVFGHDGCIGDPGHCEWKPGIREFDVRPQHLNLPIDVIVSIKDAIVDQVKSGRKSFQITIVPVTRPAQGATLASVLDEEVDLKLQPVKSKIMVRGDGLKTLEQAIEIPGQ